MEKIIFTAFEWNACQEDDQGCVSAIPCSEPNDRIDFYSVYGRLKEGGVECIGDFNSAEHAEAICNALNNLIR